LLAIKVVERTTIIAYQLGQFLLVELGSNEAIKRAVELGAGVGIVSREVVRTELAAGTLRALAIRERGFVHPIDLVYHRDRSASPLIAAVLDVARALRGRRTVVSSAP